MPFVLIVVVPLTDKVLLMPDKLIVSDVPSPNTALPVIANEYSPLSAEFVVTVLFCQTEYISVYPEVRVISLLMLIPPAAV